VVVGVAAAVLMVYSPTAEKTLYPLLLFAQVVPKIAVAPLFVVWLGFGLSPKILIAVLIAFFPVVISSVTGLKSVDPEILDLAATMGANTWKTFVKIRFPGSLPFLFSGLKVAVTLAVTGALVSEFVGANEGLGFVILQANGNLDTPTLFAGLLMLTAIGVLLFVAVELAERWACPGTPAAAAARRQHHALVRLTERVPAAVTQQVSAAVPQSPPQIPPSRRATL